jgi:hypothetical protein
VALRHHSLHIQGDEVICRNEEETLSRLGRLLESTGSARESSVGCLVESKTIKRERPPRCDGYSTRAFPLAIDRDTDIGEVKQLFEGLRALAVCWVYVVTGPLPEYVELQKAARDGIDVWPFGDMAPLQRTGATGFWVNLRPRAVPRDSGGSCTDPSTPAVIVRGHAVEVRPDIFSGESRYASVAEVATMIGKMPSCAQGTDPCPPQPEPFGSGDVWFAATGPGKFGELLPAIEAAIVGAAARRSTSPDQVRIAWVAAPYLDSLVNGVRPNGALDLPSPAATHRRAGPIETLGDLPAALVDCRVGEGLSRAWAKLALEHARTMTERLVGTFAINVDVAPTGAVAKVTITNNTLGDGELATRLLFEVREALMTVTFPPTRIPEQRSFRYPVSVVVR